MISNSFLISSFIIGLLGGVHCVGMCGGIVGVLSMGLDQKAGKVRHFMLQLNYNFGRITSYAIAGFIFGWLGEAVARSSGSHNLHQYLQTFSGVFMLLLGMYLSGWWQVLVKVEKIGAVLWRRIEPFARTLIPVRSVPQAYLVGLVWGWLPCGLVYSVLISALGSGSGANGAMIMFSFGLGTLPNLLAMGLLAGALRQLLHRPIVRYLAGMLVMGFGVYFIWQAWQPMAGHMHH
jgi:sulfite exporter TauE/SafE